MSLAMGAASAPLKIFHLSGTILSEDFDSLKICQKKRTSLPLRPVTCSSSFSSPPQEAPATPSHHRETPPSSSSSTLTNFKPPPPSLPVTPKDLATDLPFHYWYSYADLPPGIPKRRPKNKNLAVTFKSGENSDPAPGLEKGGRGSGSSGGLWEAALTVESGKNMRDMPKVGRRRGRGGDLRNAEKRLSLEDHQESLKRSGAVLQEEEDTPLSEKEVKELIQTCHGTSRQINMGWEGWNPNYVALVHGYWKRSQVCKIKCKGVVTLDMDAICNTLEAETGGKVIGHSGGAVYLFRGWNYKYWRDARQVTVGRQRIVPQFPKQLKYPKRLPIPCSLTKEDLNALRARGRELPALYKLGKNGVYLSLLDDVRQAFKTQDLVRVNCQGFHAKSFKTLGFNLQALVPCELISFEFEHILMWRRKNGISSNEELTEVQSE